MPAISEEIKLKNGSSVTISLKGLFTAGYEWSYTIDGDKDCIKIFKDLDLSEKSVKKNTGISANEIFTISGQNKGVANIHFTQQRPWEKKAEPVNEKKVKVVVE